MRLSRLGLLVQMYVRSKIIKRLFDIVISAAGLIILSPIIILTAIAVYFCLGRPILYRQKRTGLNNTDFHVVKFRSMLDSRDASGNVLSDAERLTFFGKFIRAASIDELPSLWDVFRGKMSIVGPRPQDAKYYSLYTDRQKRRHQVKPGLTGWAQINGRNAITWEKRFELDLWYVENQSFWLDLKICFLTVPVVLFQRGINAPGHATMPAFKGNENEKSSQLSPTFAKQEVNQ